MNIKESEITEIESEIIQYINEYKKEEYSKVIEKDNRLEIILALSNIRENIINWYPFKENATILEIGADFGQLTGFLCKNATKVVSLETSEEKRKAIAKRYEEIKNLTLIGKIEEIKEKFDYIAIIGIENISDYPKEILKELKKYLKTDGKILMATDNKIGIKYFSTNNNGEDVTNIYNKKLYNFEELMSQIEEAGFKQKKVYYPMTDYKLTNVIYTDKKPLSKNNLARNIVYNKEDTIKFYEQNKVYKELLKDDGSNSKTFINSFLVEIFNGEYEENGIKLVAFSNIRKPQYRIKTIMKENAVYKYPISKEGIKHIEDIKNNIDIMERSNIKTLDSYDEEKIISKYSDAKTLDKVFIKFAKDDKTKVIELIKRFKQELLQKLEEGNKENNVFDKYHIQYEKETIENMKFTKYGLWDLIFQNCFYIDEEFYFFDQEWREENLPIEYILYRAVKYFDRIEKYIPKKELYEILELKEKQIKIFDELDDKIQEEIRDSIAWKVNTQGKTLLDLKREKLTDSHTINLLRMENQELKEKNNKLKEENDNLNKELNNILQSKSWKITEPLRKIRKLSKNK